MNIGSKIKTKIRNLKAIMDNFMRTIYGLNSIDEKKYEVDIFFE
jgi:hypothetical protein